MSFFTLVPMIREYKNFLIFFLLNQKIPCDFFSFIFLSKLLVSILHSGWTGTHFYWVFGLKSGRD